MQISEDIRKKFFYAIGASANGVKTDAFTYFLLFFYSQVIGLSSDLASLAILIALIIDAITDPVMGFISDRTTHRNGKRHPYFLIGFLPMSLSYFMLFSIQQDWNLTQGQLFAWMLSFVLLTRLGMTIFEIPHRSFGGDMSSSYTERTKIFAWRELFQQGGGLFNAFLAYTIFFKSTPEFKDGFTNPDPWLYYGITGASIMIITVMLTYFGTLKYKSPEREFIKNHTLKLILKQISIAFKNKTFVLFFFGYLFIAASWGLSSSLQIFVSLNFWKFEPNILKYFIPVYGLAVLSSFAIISIASRWYEKRNMLLVAIFFAAVIHALPFPLAVNGYFPEWGSWGLFYATAPFLLLSSTGLAASSIVRESMLGDISDEVELQSGFGQKGLMFAASSLIGKINTGLGIFMAGIALKLIEFPDAKLGIEPTEEQIYNLGLTQGPIVSLFMIIPFFIFLFYKIDRNKHESIIKNLNSQKISS